MIIERSMADGWLSNTYLVAAAPGGDAFLVDAGGPVAPLLAKADDEGLTLTHVLLTHHHHDHVAELGEVLERWPDAQVLAHPDERVPGTTGDLPVDGELEAGGLTVEGVESTRDVRRLAAQRGVQLPFHDAVHRVLFESARPLEVLEVLR
jgi:hydroxyacylglutathione hydrolase